MAGIEIPTTIARIIITANNSTNVNPLLFNFLIFLSSLYNKNISYKVIIVNYKYLYFIYSLINILIDLLP